MPRKKDEVSLTAKRHLADRWWNLTVDLGWGVRGRFKFLTALLDFAEENMSLFRKR